MTQELLLARSILLLTAFLSASPASAQRLEPESAIAVAGSPFGVGRIDFEMPWSMIPEPLEHWGLRVSERQGRVLYPAVSIRPARGLFRRLLERPRRVTVHFLFVGSEPLAVTVAGETVRTFAVTPRNDPGAHLGTLHTWWKDYVSPRELLLRKRPKYPPLVDNYLQSMLAARLGLTLDANAESEAEADSWQALLKQELRLAAATEEVRLGMVRRRFRGEEAFSESATLPVPAFSVSKPIDVSTPKAVEIEPLARRVPREWFYVRFGGFDNFLWIQDTLGRWEGDMRNLLFQRGVSYNASERIQRTLVLRQSALARLFGGTVIEDVAMVGTDLYLREGAAVGFLFQARAGNPILGNDFRRQRAERLEQKDGVTEKKLKFGSHEISFLSTPDGRVRSYYVEDEGFHLITTSRTMVKQFLSIGRKNTSLGDSPGFRHARVLMPLERQDAVFAYFSDVFFANLFRPQYRIETTRRVQALADLEMVQLASLAAAAEGVAASSIEELVAGGYLPFDFGPRPDGSRTVFTPEATYDSLRGYRGAFVPIADVPVERVTPTEHRHYTRLARTHAEQWDGFDPMILGIQRETLDDQSERITIDAHVSPMAEKHFQKLREWVGVADNLQRVEIEGDVAAAEAIFARQRLFAGVADIQPPRSILEGVVQTILGDGDLVVGYLGGVGRPVGWLAAVDRFVPGHPDPAGYTRGLMGVWRRYWGDYTFYSLHPEVLDAVAPQVRFEQAAGPAQFRLHVKDLGQSPMADALNDILYARTRHTLLGNLHFMHEIGQQLRVPGDYTKKAAELILDAQPVCPLGGEYQMRPTPDGLGCWVSTKLDHAVTGGPISTDAPADFLAPPLQWLGGLDATVLIQENRAIAHIEILMHPETDPPSPP